MHLLTLLPALCVLAAHSAPLSLMYPQLRTQERPHKDHGLLQTHSLLHYPHTNGLLNARSSRNPPRCGVPDIPVPLDSSSGRNRQKRFVLSGGRWDKTNLTYKIIRFPWQLSKVKVRRTIAEALMVWSEVTPLTFTEVHEGRSDIIIDFTRYWHGDNLPFDGPGGILAHAFFPKTHREGDVHFDYDEAWTIGNNIGTDLLQVAAHEFGHMLGLQHSSVSKSLMSPFYTFRYPLSLSADDKHGIQFLYGAPHPPTPSPTPRVEVNQVENESNEIPAAECLQFVESYSSSSLVMCGAFVVGNCRMATQPWHHATGEASLTLLMQHLKILWETSGSSMAHSFGFLTESCRPLGPFPLLTLVYQCPRFRPPLCGALRRTRKPICLGVESTGDSTQKLDEWKAGTHATLETGEGYQKALTLPSRMNKVMPIL
ncbi:stromelysin-3 isoform X2 [Xenopus tropicalis]|uniref:Stromelysin-3 isoform X2 n=1 Tax=Xenopus tropicalis TaxID=8364 RepID=A0A8J0T0Z7_XENTR|nr:stromelysin-3 isoform X2 [Xenopus tropicalis]|eukprot:XP_017945690.1 PREDICTED: stromelysin-3 isoform X2 [Xenopus tropicalis]